MSNYPPGVTGNEPQIAGLPEGQEFMECSNQIPAVQVQVVIGLDVDLRDELGGSLTIAPYRDDWLKEHVFKLADCGGQEEIDCPFKGVVDVQYSGEPQVAFGVEAYADCPVCGQEMWKQV